MTPEEIEWVESAMSQYETAGEYTDEGNQILLDIQDFISRI